jgi:hypothetical protein
MSYLVGVGRAVSSQAGQGQLVGGDEARAAGFGHEGHVGAAADDEEFVFVAAGGGFDFAAGRRGPCGRSGGVFAAGRGQPRGVAPTGWRCAMWVGRPGRESYKGVCPYHEFSRPAHDKVMGLLDNMGGLG